MAARILAGLAALCAAVWIGAWIAVGARLPWQPARSVAAAFRETEHAGRASDARREPPGSPTAPDSTATERRGAREPVALELGDVASLSVPDGPAASSRDSRQAGCEPLAARELVACVEALRDDTVRGNALEALARLRSAGPEVLPALQAALRSSDWQQRQLAGWLLAERDDAPATQALADVLVEALQEDELPCGWRTQPDLRTRVHAMTPVDNRETALATLRLRADLCAFAERPLYACLHAPEERTRAEAAYLLACQRSTLAQGRVLLCLIEHLADNSVEGDAALALRGLYRLGADARPALERAWPGVDEQQRALLGHLLATLAPDSPAARRLAPKELVERGFWRGDPLLLEQQGWLP